MRISDVLRGKGSDVATVGPRDSVRDLLDLLAQHNIGAMVVVDDDETVAGIVSERDIVRRLRERGADLLGTAVAEIMTSDVVSCRPDDTVDSLAETMTARRIRHAPVLTEDGGLVGIVSIGDIVKSRINQLESDRQQLESYIAQG
jgi:CBS domain-containing protein